MEVKLSESADKDRFHFVDFPPANESLAYLHDYNVIDIYDI